MSSHIMYYVQVLFILLYFITNRLLENDENGFYVGGR